MGGVKRVGEADGLAAEGRFLLSFELMVWMARERIQAKPVAA